jgi:AcrR family transcriptional regulator
MDEVIYLGRRGAGAGAEGNLAAKKKRKTLLRSKNPERTKANIIEVATAEFAELGLTGARVDRIAERTHTSKRMIYYYFGDKEGLYRAVLLSYYEKLRSAEAELNLRHQPPMVALKALVEFTFDYHLKNAAIARLVVVENINKGRHVAKLPSVAGVNVTILDTVADILERGEAEGVIRPGLDSFDLYITIAALCFFNVSNRYTIRAIFRHDMGDPKEAATRRESIWETIRRSVIAEKR